MQIQYGKLGLLTWIKISKAVNADTMGTLFL